MTNAPGANDDELPDEVSHIKRATELLADDRDMRHAASAVNLIGWLLSSMPQPRWDDAFPNDLAATACIVRAYRQLRASITLVLSGYYGEVRMVLRGAYESAGLSRVLAKEVEDAQRWLDKNEWYPDGKVTRWLKAVRGEASEYGRFYGKASAWAHPTSVSCLPLIDPTGDVPRLKLMTEFNEETLRTCIKDIATTALFVAFALRNAAADENALPPEWRETLMELSQEVLEHDMPHLQRDWERERAIYDAFKERVQTANELYDRLQNDPRSTHNLKPGTIDG